MRTTDRRTFQAEKTARAQSLRQGPNWLVQETVARTAIKQSKHRGEPGKDVVREMTGIS